MGFWKRIFGNRQAADLDEHEDVNDPLFPNQTTDGHSHSHDHSHSHSHSHEHTPAHQDGFGDKSIGFFGGFALNMNNITGPAMVTIPLIYQKAGWFTPTLSFLVIMVISTLSSTMLCEAMKLVPRSHKKERIELTTLAKIFFHPSGYILTHILLFFSLTSLNVASIVESAQTMDSAMLTAFNWAGALEAIPHFGFRAINEPMSGDSPFGDSYVLSLGFIIVLCMTIPLGYFNLDDNVHVQKGAVICLFVIVIEWFISFGYQGMDANKLQAFRADQSNVLGTVIFNYAFVTSIPSWLNEKRAGVSINKTIWSATTLSTILFIAVGVCGAMVYDFSDNEDLLGKFRSDNFPKVFHVVTQIFVCVYPLVVFLTSIPVFSIIIRYNLMESKICGKFWANVWGVLFPWVLSVVLYSGSIINDVINWTGFVNGGINFVIPLLLYVLAKRRKRLQASGQIQEGQADDSIEDQGEKDDDDEEESFTAIPLHWKFINAEKLAIFLAFVFSVLLVMVTLLNILSAVHVTS